MKNFIIALIACVAILSLWFYVNKKNSPEPATNSNSNTTNTVDSSNTSTNNQSTSSGAGQYVNYSANVIASTEGTKILFFHAPWCPQCRSLDNSIKSGNIPSNVTFIKVDYDSSQPLRKKYGVTIQTTLVKVDDLGNLVEKYVAYESPTLSAVIENLL